MEQKLEEQEAKIEAATKAKELPELIVLIEKKRDRFVEEEKDLRQQLSALQAQLAGVAGGRSWFLSLANRRLAKASVFYLLDDNNTGVGVGVFFSETRAVTADHNLLDRHSIGSGVEAIIPAHREQLRLTVRARFPDDGFAILESARSHAFIPPYEEPPQVVEEEEVEGEDLVLTGYRIGLEGNAPHFSSRLGFTKASSIAFSAHRRHLFYQCPTYAMDSGAALLLKDGRLIGIHQEAVNALRERLAREKTIKGCLTAAEESIDQIVSGGLAQGGCALLSHVFINA